MEAHEFLHYFNKDFFIQDLQSRSKEDVFHEMVMHITQKSPLKDSRLILDMLQRREKLGSTGIGEGIAIPHGRSISAANLTVTYGKSVEGIDFDAIDEKPVYHTFMIIAPPQEQSNIYLPFLGKLVEIVKQKKVRDNLQKAETFQKFIDALAGGF